MPPIPFVDLKAQLRSVRAEIDAAIKPILDECNFILGAPVAEFEAAFAEFVGAGHAIGTSDGLDALTLSLRAVGVGPGDEVIVPANTFIATALAVTQAGAAVRLVDCDPGTWEIDVSQIEAAITPRTKAIVPVHLYGMSADMNPIISIANEFGLGVVEDAGQAHGTRYEGIGCGSLGDVSAFSFSPAKNLGACGDGGMVVTNDPAIADQARLLRNYGSREKYVHLQKGVNSRLEALQAAILSVKLRHLSTWNAARSSHAARYRELLSGVGDLRFQRQDPSSTHNHHRFVFETAHRDALQKHLKQAGVETIIHYPTPIHRQKAYEVELAGYAGQLPVSEQLAGRILSLPMFPELTEEQILQVASSVQEFYAAVARHARTAA
ncbi:MAG TPA: DegT/DnrJ/EryC1/StrS family aminotransferase [Opitutaceae bacterium]|jgi:dTDP-4-amino-4,6-dideoxygalactose transaminase